MLPDIALSGSFLVAGALALWLGYTTLAFVLLHCSIGGMSAGALWRHYKTGESREWVKWHWIIVVWCALVIVSLSTSPNVFDWLEAD